MQNIMLKQLSLDMGKTEYERICRKAGFRILHIFYISTIFPSVTAESGIRHPSIWKRSSVQEIWGTVSQRDTEEKDTAVFYSKNY